ncbi:hypothetical protein ISF9_105 [Microbacterium phage vB_MoxS-ISF9]|uniref:Uncharacterized protein n=1 Tax=Microbacterium phage vB_MoxS-ISF9 TaxID=1458670 RepID=W8NNP7_9CAUD|nr:hypothetical protein ISF9_105 [Microbacterium phage vB_MoxS-ISF9]AHL18575.1 hypothetical protein ISF9_105 [Microbacterium phage vB_MoxS-ISF9]
MTAHKKTIKDPRVESEVNFIKRHLVKTVDKKELLATLRTWREESDSSVEADLLRDLIEEVDSGALDG